MEGKIPNIKDFKAIAPRSGGINKTKPPVSRLGASPKKPRLKPIEESIIKIDETKRATLLERTALFFDKKEESKIEKIKDTPHINRDKRTIYIPSGLMSDSDNYWYIAIFMEKASKIMDFKLETYGSGAIEFIEDRDILEFMKGLVLGLEDLKPLNLTYKKSILEQGRTSCFGIKCRGEFRIMNRMKFFLKENYYLGNNPNQTIGDKKVPNAFKQYVQNYFIDQEIGKQIASLMTTILEYIALSQYSTEDFKSAIEKVTISFDSYLEDNYSRPLFELRKKKMVKVGERLPRKPNSSPLIHKEEMKLIHSILSPTWNNLDSVKKNWYLDIWSPSIEKNLDFIDSIMKMRWNILEKFGSITTKRLQEVRLTDKTKKFSKKAEVTNTDLLNFLIARKSSVINEFFIEISKLIPKASRWTVLEEVNKEFSIESDDSYKESLTYEILKVYLKIPELKLSQEAAKKVVLQSDIYTEAKGQMENLVQKYRHVERTVAAIIQRDYTGRRLKDQIDSLTLTIKNIIYSGIALKDIFQKKPLLVGKVLYQLRNALGIDKESNIDVVLYDLFEDLRDGLKMLKKARDLNETEIKIIDDFIYLLKESEKLV
jgi:hypothetical protein